MNIQTMKPSAGTTIAGTTVIRNLLLPLLLCSSLAAPGVAETLYGDPSAWAVEAPDQPSVVVVRDATLWTNTGTNTGSNDSDGVLETTDLLVVDGRISAIGTDLDVPGDALVIDAAGRHVTPGLIDAHSHTAITGGVNEGTNIVTSEVRIGDVIDPDDVDLYRQLAGGLTAANLLHGSANAIGGQNAVIKLRWGQDAAGLLFAEAPQGIKFALGENPKQSNWDVAERRFPQTRQGVEQIIREHFLAARDYRDALEAWRNGGKAAGEVPPKRDLQLEAIVEILEGSRLVHSHSYRADEILMLLELTHSFGVRVASFQHVNEGYKVAHELAAYGAGASTFSDWWAYKYEVIDAIPHNGAIMWRDGVSVSFNSDDDELARRMNLEAAKAVRWGGVPEAEALKFITLEPAKQLGIDEWVGSLEVGKHADFVVWSGHPLSTYSIVEQTWIDGRKYFDRQADLAARETLAEERRALLEKARAAKASSEEKDGEEETADPAEEGPPGQDPGPEDPPPQYLGHAHDHPQEVR